MTDQTQTFAADSDTIKDTYNWFVEARSEPTLGDFNTQLGVHVEEFAEMLVELFPTSQRGKHLVEKAREAVHLLAEFLKTTPNAVAILEDNRKDFLDSLVDQIVTATGTAQTQRMLVPGALNAVNIANYSKFVDGKPIFDENGKVAKGPNYVKADLSPFV